MFAASALATSDQPPDFGPVFVGGSGRSGTTIVSRLLGTHSRLARIRTEARFHADDRHGLIGLLRGRQDLAGFLAWMRSPDAWGRLASVIAPGELDRVLTDFASRFDRDRLAASRFLLRAVFDRVARGAGAETWVEMTPSSIDVAPELASVFPNARIVHMLRDGRDVACSRVAKNGGEATRWLTDWEDRVRRADAATRELPRSQVIVIQLEDLVLHRRSQTYAALLDFLACPDEPGIRAWFERRMPPGNAHIGRWRQDLPVPLQREIEELYAARLRSMTADGVAALPVDR